MFDKEYSFRGKHAVMVEELTAVLSTTGESFRNFDVYLLAPLIGFLYNERADKDSDSHTTKVFAEIMMKNSDDLEFNYRLIMLLDKDYEPDSDKRIDKAFRGQETQEDMERYDSYVRGGVEKLYEKIIKGNNTEEEYMSKLFDFLEEFDERYNQKIDLEKIQELCKKIR